MSDKRVVVESYDKDGKKTWCATVEADAEVVGKKMREYLDRGLIPVLRWNGVHDSIGERMLEGLKAWREDPKRAASLIEDERENIEVDMTMSGERFYACGDTTGVLDAQEYFLEHIKEQRTIKIEPLMNGVRE